MCHKWVRNAVENTKKRAIVVSEASGIFCLQPFRTKFCESFNIQFGI